MSKKILIIEDEKNLARFVSLELQHEGYSVVAEENGRQGLQLALNEDFDLVLLDLMLPDMDGYEITRRLRLEKEYLSIIMMTARHSTMDIVAGLDRGADDYIVKPFAIEELLARIRAVFRRQDAEHKVLKEGQNKEDAVGLKLNPQNRSVIRGQEDIPLTKREYDLLSILLSNTNRVLTRKELLSNVWKYDKEVDTSVVDGYSRYIPSWKIRYPR